MDEYLLDGVFHKFILDDDTVLYWRSCVLRAGMRQGEQGYMLYWPDFDINHHTYRNPEWTYEGRIKFDSRRDYKEN